jgi:hypothetical protein
MSDTGWLSAVPLIGLVLLLVLLEEVATRKNAREDRAPHMPTPTAWPKLVIVLACTAGAAWLVPWAAFLPLTDTSGLLPGVLFTAMLSIGVLYALRDLESGN